MVLPSLRLGARIAELWAVSGNVLVILAPRSARPGRSARPAPSLLLPGAPRGRPAAHALVLRARQAVDGGGGGSALTIRRQRYLTNRLLAYHSPAKRAATAAATAAGGRRGRFSLDGRRTLASPQTGRDTDRVGPRGLVSELGHASADLCFGRTLSGDPNAVGLPWQRLQGLWLSS